MGGGQNAVCLVQGIHLGKRHFVQSSSRGWVAGRHLAIGNCDLLERVVHLQGSVDHTGYAALLQACQRLLHLLLHLLHLLLKVLLLLLHLLQLLLYAGQRARQVDSWHIPQQLNLISCTVQFAKFPRFGC